MANEAVLVQRIGDPIDFIVADGTGIEKGTHLQLTDPMTASITSGAGQMFAGIAHREKIANDGRTRLAVWRKGIFRMRCGGTIAIGAPVKTETGGTNEILTADTGTSGAGVIGIALEAGTDGTDILVELNIQGGAPNA